MCQKPVEVHSKNKGLGDHIIKFHPDTQKKMYKNQNSTPSKSRVEQLNAELLSRDLSEIKVTPDNNTASTKPPQSDVSQSDVAYIEEKGFACIICHGRFNDVKRYIRHLMLGGCGSTHSL